MTLVYYRYQLNISARIRNKYDFSDVTPVCEDKHIKSHKLVKFIQVRAFKASQSDKSEK